MNYNSILISEVKGSEKRQALLNTVVAKLKTVEDLIDELEKTKNNMKTIKKIEIKKYEEMAIQYRQKEISDIEFMKKGKKHNHRLNYLDLKILSLDMMIDSKRNLARRLHNLGWLFKIPDGLEEVKFVNKKTGEEKRVNKKAIYNEFIKNVIDAEKNRITKEQSFTILKRDFNNVKKSGCIVEENHEFYGVDKELEDRLYYLKEEKERVQKYTSQNIDDYAGFIDYSFLTIGDFTSENTEVLFDKIFLENNDKRKIV